MEKYGDKQNGLPLGEKNFGFSHSSVHQSNTRYINLNAKYNKTPELLLEE
jgi:hypothetical protein